MSLLEQIILLVIPAVMNVVSAIVAVLVGRWLAHSVRARMHRTLARAKLTESLTLLLVTATYYGIWVVAILVALGLLGVPTTTIIAVGGVVVIVLGIALQASVANFAATVIFALFQPFRVGELVEFGTVMGTVREIQLFNTVLLTGDNLLVTLPNGNIQQGQIVNYTRLGVVRIDLTCTIRYSDDLPAAKQALLTMMAADGRVLADPAPAVVVLDLADNGVTLGVRPHVKSADYWDVQFDLRERIKLQLEQAGIELAIPQREVHVVQPDRMV